jgi:hypothetical protein
MISVIQVNVSPSLDSAPKSFLLRSVREKQQHVSVVATSIKEETIQEKLEKSRAALTGYNQPSPPWKLSSHLHEKINFNTSHTSANSQSSFDNFQLPTNTGRTRFGELSVFSPIMSSSRMEPATNTKIAGDDFDSHKKTSFLLSDHHNPLSKHYPPLTEASLMEEQHLNESLIDIATPVFRRSAKFEPNLNANFDFFSSISPTLYLNYVIVDSSSLSFISYPSLCISVSLSVYLTVTSCVSFH